LIFEGYYKNYFFNQFTSNIYLKKFSLILCLLSQTYHFENQRIFFYDLKRIHGFLVNNIHLPILIILQNVFQLYRHLITLMIENPLKAGPLYIHPNFYLVKLKR